MAGDTVRILADNFNPLANEFVGKIIMVHKDGRTVSVSIGGFCYDFNHNDLELISGERDTFTVHTLNQDSDNKISVNEEMANVTSKQILFTVSRNGNILFECRSMFHAHMAKNELERLESEIAQLKAQIANFQQQIDFMRGNADE